MNQVNGTDVSCEITSLLNPLDEIATARLGELLPAHVATRRWYRAKTRVIREVRIADVVAIDEAAAYVLILDITYEQGESDRYILPVSVAAASGDPQEGEPREEVIARLSTKGGEEGVLFSALGDDRFRDALLHAVVCEKNYAGRQGFFHASRTGALVEDCTAAIPKVASFVSRAEQSNTSVIYRDRYIFKLFRKLEAGVNPDLEIGRFLTKQGFRYTPAVLGSLEYQDKQQRGRYAAGILQQFVPNQGDAWKYTLDSLATFFPAALASKRIAPRLLSEHPLELIGQDIPSELRSVAGDYFATAALLGQRTAEMHAALSSDPDDPDFAPEPFTSADSEHLYRDLFSQAETTYGLLHRKRDTLTGDLRAAVDQLLAFEDSILERCAAVRERPFHADRIRHHGDYHLGQVLSTGGDFMIIDFEGEPARPLAERRLKALALRDVAGMLRSFQYAAFAALFGQIPGLPDDRESIEAVTAWAAAWNGAVSSLYLQAYFETADGSSFVPSDWGERRLLLDVFLLQKALYEVAYELNNRPEWLPIPVRGILMLMSA